ncbi:MAG: hypothetical protein IJV06_07710 [Bacteroidaceae bacterium]|nr:hypothetical protein [Bacteroidaceae bacterium]
MKKTYITPALHVEHIQVELPIAVSQTTMSKNSSNKIENSGDILTKDRGDYMPEDNATYGDLW